MNRIYRVIWSRIRNAWVVASELAAGRGKSGTATVSGSATRVERHDRRVSMRARPLRMAILATLFALQAPTHAADRYWDANRTSPGLGDAGSWDLTNAFWDTQGDGISGPYLSWDNAALDDAFFNDVGGTVTLGVPITVHNMSFGANGFTLDGGTLTLAGTTPTITTLAGTATINSVLAGTSGLIKAGTGALTLNGINTFTGDIELALGSFYAGSDAALGAAGNNITTGTGALVRLSIGGAIDTSRTVTIGDGGTLILEGVRAGSALVAGNGAVRVGTGVTMSNDASTYTGITTFYGCNGVCTTSFTSIADLGVASSLGAPTTVANGTIYFSQSSQYSDNLIYLGDGDSSNRNWSINGSAAIIRNRGTGALTLTGDIVNTANPGSLNFYAEQADIALLGEISGTTRLNLGGSAGRTITLTGANTYTRETAIGDITVVASVLADRGTVSSFGTGESYVDGGETIEPAIAMTNAALSYTGAGAASDRSWTIQGANSIRNDGTGALTLSGPLSFVAGGAADTLTLGGSYAGAANTFSGPISGAGGLVVDGDGTWVLSGANTYTGGTTVQSGTLRAGGAEAFGTTGAATVNGGTLDLADLDTTFTTLSGSGGVVALDSATLTLNAAAGNTNYAGNLTGTGGLAKFGASTQTLSGANTYTGATTIGGGTLGLNFAAAGGPTSDIVSSSSTLNMGGGTLSVTGAANENNTQTFNGLNITGGTNNVSVTSGASGSITLDLGAINRTGGLIDFDLPTNGFITTSNTSLGGWATVNNGSTYAKIVGGNISAFDESDYTVQDDASLWQDGQFITDGAGFTTSSVDSADDTLQLGGLRYTAASATTLNIASGDTLGIDGNILVAPSVAGFNQTISGGSLTGPLGGGTLGIQQNSTGTFTIASQIVDNGSDAVGFTKGGTGAVVLADANTYTGPTVISLGTLTVGNIADGGDASSIGASSADSANLVIEGGTLQYTGASATTDRGFTVVRGGPKASEISVSNGAANLTFTGLVTSLDDADFTKSGSGTLTLANAANNYAGVTTVMGGILSVGTLANGGTVSGIGRSTSASSNLVLSAGGTLQYTGDTVSSDRGFTLDGSAGGVIDVTDVDTTLTLGGTAAGTDLHKAGAGTLVLAGTNVYSGSTTVDGGTLRAGSESAFGGPARMNLADAAGVTLDLAGFDNKIGGLSGGGANGGNVLLGDATLTLGGSNVSFSGSISGIGGLYKDNSSTQTMVGCNHTYTGVTTIYGGTLSVDCLADGGDASGIGASTSDAANLVIRGTLDYTGGDVSIDRGFEAAGGTVSVAAGSTLEFGGQVTGGNFTKSGAGTLVLSGTNDNGVTFVNGGTLRAGSNAAFGVGGIRFDVAGATLDLAGYDNTVKYLHEHSNATNVANRNVLLDGASLTINGGNGFFSGVISGDGGLIKSVGDTQTLLGCDNSYTGSTRVTGGALSVACLDDGGSNSSIGSSSADASNLYIGGTLSYVGAGSTTDRQFTIGTGGGTLTASGTGAVNFTSTAPITLEGSNARTLILRGTNTDDNTLAAQITDASAGATRLTKTDAGTWMLTNPNSTYTGITTVSGGVLSVSKLVDGLQASSIGASSSAASNLVIGNGSTLRYTGTGNTTDRLFTLAQGVTFIESSGTGAIQFTNTAPVTLSGSGARTIALGGTNTGNNTMGGTIADASVSGKTTLAKNDSGTWVLTGDNTYTGNTVINDGNLVIGNGGTSGNAGAGNVIVDSATSTLSINRSDAFDFDGTLSGPGSLAQIGAGVTRLTAADNSIGATTVSAGTLQVAAGGGLTTSTIAMNGASTLDVEGIVQGSGGTAAVFTGDTGASTINVYSGGSLLASGDLGDGSDTVNVEGTLDTGAAGLSLGDGDDTFILNDGAAISGAGIDASAAATADTLQVNNAVDRVFDGSGFSGFEQLAKQNTGVLTLTGTQSFSAGVAVDDGTLDVDGTLDTAGVTLAGDTTLNIGGIVQAAGGSAAEITGSAGVNTVLVNGGATLNANGDLGDGSDVVTVAGTLETGAGVLSLGAGDDTFTLTDGAVISGTGIDGGAATTADVLVLDNATALTFDGNTTAGFEQLIKQNTGVATMVGSQAFGDGTSIDNGTLVIGGTLQTPSIAMADDTTLQVDGAVYVPGPLPTEITGSAGVNTILVGAPSQLFATGDLGTGNDVVLVSGRLDTGAGILSLGDDDDTLILGDGAAIVGSGVDASTGANDELVLANQFALTFDGATTAGFEQLTKQNTGIATMTGTQSFVDTTISGGTLDIDGTLETATVDLADGTTLNVDGTVQAAGATQTTITGTSGTNTVNVNEDADLLASGDLGDGDDVLDVAGTLDIGGGTFMLGDGDDSFVVHDGTTVVGTVDGGAGFDTRVYDIELTAAVGVLAGFEGLTKDGAGTLNINGPGSSTLEGVEVLGGTLNVGAAGGIDSAQSTTIASGATLNVDGTYSGTTGDDTFTVAGTVGGAGSIDLGAGDDALTLQDGVTLSTVIDGGGATDGDSLVLDNASALTLDGSNVAGFEDLVKQNAGVATLTGAHSYDSATVDDGTLDVDGTLETATVALDDDTALNVDGLVQAAGATQTAITGTAGANTVVVNTGGSLLASGDLGDGDDILDLAGTLDTGGGTFSLGAGDDTFVVHDTTEVIGALDAGDGNDLLNVNVSTSNIVSLGSTTGFESLGKSGAGALEINGPSDFQDVEVQAGLLDIDAAGSIAAQTVDVSAGATLNVDGALTFTTGADDFTVGGTVTGAGAIDMLDGDDQLTILDGADLSGLATSLEGGAGSDTLTADIETSATLGGATGFETLSKEGVGTLNIDGPASSSFETVDVQDGSLYVAASANVTNVTATTVASDATLNVDGSYTGSAGNDTFVLAGSTSGAGTIDLGTGDDVLTLQDGATLGAAIDAGGETVGDRVVLDNAAAYTLDRTSIAGFEQLVKQNTGTATLTGAHVFDSVAIDAGTLDVDQSLETASATLASDTTLNVDGTMQAVGGGQTTITGSAGVNTVVVSDGATLVASGDLGDGSDVLDVGGTLDAGGGSFNLGAGDDSFVIHDGTNVIGTVVGGDGFDTRIYDIAGTASVGALQEFEGLTKRNSGALNITGPATSDLLAVEVEGGELNVAAAGVVAGVQSTTVLSGATLNVDGTYAGSTGDDSFTVAGTVSGTGSIYLGDGDDVLTLQDGAVLATTIDGGAVGADQVVLDTASDFTFDGANVASFEHLVKQNTGAATLTGAHNYDSTAIDGGTLDVDGTLETATVALADDATLNVDGLAQAAGGSQTTITGTAGDNTVVVGAGATLLASGDLGDGADVLDVGGTLDIGGGTFDLGAGDDSFIVRDGTTVVGTVDGGDGFDTRVYDINLTADLGAITGFEGLTKTGEGVLNIHGPGNSDLADVQVLGGMLNIDAGGGIENITSATVGTGATLNIDGDFLFTAAADELTIAGGLTGTGSLDLLDGDDQLTLLDGADLSGLAAPLDGGAGVDTVTADIATTAKLGGVTGFEMLTKQGVGSLSVAGLSTSFDTVRVEEGVLDVASGGTLEAHNAVVESGATLNIAGDFLFTAGADSFEVAGTVTGLGAVDMLDGDDELILRDGADMSGLAIAIDGGAGIDTLTADIATTATLGGANGFETLAKEGVGSLTIAGPAGSMFDTVLVHAGLLEVAADAVVDPQTTVIDAGAALAVAGTYSGTADADTFTVSGTLSGDGSVDLLDNDDTLTINNGATLELSGSFDAGNGIDSFVLAGDAGSDDFDMSLVGSTFENFEAFRKEGAGTWRLNGAGDRNWTVAAGTLIGDSVSFGGDIDNAGTVIFDQADDGDFDGVLSGAGTLIKQNAGTLRMTAENTFTGATQVTAGMLQIDGALPGSIMVAGGAGLSGIGTVGGVTTLAGGFVSPGSSGSPFGTLTIGGSYSGAGAVVINSQLGDETSPTSRLVIQGNVSGSSTLLVNNAGGSGAQTTGDGIEIIQVDGTSAADNFDVAQPVQAGAYQYLLYQGGTADTNDWYLRSELIDPEHPPVDPEAAYRPGVPGYVLGHQANLEYGFTALGNLRARVGDQGRVPHSEENRPTDAWMRVYAQDLSLAGSRFEAQNLQMGGLQFGTDILTHDVGKAGAHLGVMASVGESRTEFFDPDRAIADLATRTGELEMDAKGAGLYWTVHGGRTYFDVAAQFLHYRNRYVDQFATASRQDGWGGVLSAELGSAFALGSSGWQIEPQLHLAYQRLELDEFADQVSTVSAVDADGLRARAAFQLFRTPGTWLGMTDASPYAELGVQHDFKDAAPITVGVTTLRDALPDTTGDVSVGFTGSVRSGVELHLDLRYQQATEGERDGVRANFGFRMSF